jgi:uncharacterized protein (DUF1810 family)
VSARAAGAGSVSARAAGATLRSRPVSVPSASPFDLERFVAAQDAGGTYERALGELRRGRKESHWMWFVFPQLAGLGRSATSQRYAITSLEEAKAYLGHPVLGPRLVESAEAVLSAPAGVAAENVLGPVDALKLRSSMTLFHRACPQQRAFAEVLARWWAGQPDPATEALLKAQAGTAR